MKKNVLLAVALICSALLTNSKAENICYDASETSADNFWFTHMYYGTCTDYVGTGSKLAGTTGRIDFNGGSSVTFTGIRVAKDGTYTMRLTYGIGWADATGAILKLFVNDEFVSNCTFYPIAPAETQTMDISVDLVAGFDNVVTFTEQKDWPTIAGIQFVAEPTALNVPEKEKNCTISVSNGSLNVKVSDPRTSHVEVYAPNGLLVDSNYFNGTYAKSLNKGLYLVKVNGSAEKVLIQ